MLRPARSFTAAFMRLCGTVLLFGRFCAARSKRPGWEARWGDEEVARAEGAATAGGAVSVGEQGDVHPAYTGKAHYQYVFPWRDSTAVVEAP